MSSVNIYVFYQRVIQLGAASVINAREDLYVCQASTAFLYHQCQGYEERHFLQGYFSSRNNTIRTVGENKCKGIKKIKQKMRQFINNQFEQSKTKTKPKLFTYTYIIELPIFKYYVRLYIVYTTYYYRLCNGDKTPQHLPYNQKTYLTEAAPHLNMLLKTM